VRERRPTLEERLLSRLLRDSKAGIETPAPDCVKEAGLQYGARVFSLRRKGWPILNRVDRRPGSTRGFFRIDLDAFRTVGDRKLLEVAFPEEYSAAKPREPRSTYAAMLSRVPAQGQLFHLSGGGV
jgi:hypothetical protein